MYTLYLVSCSLEGRTLHEWLNEEGVVNTTFYNPLHPIPPSLPLGTGQETLLSLNAA